MAQVVYRLLVVLICVVWLGVTAAWSWIAYDSYLKRWSDYRASVDDLPDHLAKLEPYYPDAETYKRDRLFLEEILAHYREGGDIESFRKGRGFTAHHKVARERYNIARQRNWGWYHGLIFVILILAAIIVWLAIKWIIRPVLKRTNS